MSPFRIGITESGPSSGAYLREILQTWGIANHFSLPMESLPNLGPEDAAIVVGIATSALDSSRILDYLSRGGIFISCAPNHEFLDVLELRDLGLRQESALRLRVASLPSPALGGHALPIVGNVRHYFSDGAAESLASIYEPGRQDGVEGESAGILDRHVGKGRLIQFGFDLQTAVVRLRQGDPAKAIADFIGRPSDLAVNVGPQDCGWIPYADLMARLLVDLIHYVKPSPLPWIYHLPGGADALILYTGDEDGALLEANRQQLDTVAAAGGRMNLYIIPELTNSKPADVQRYQESHDVGPHPDLTPMRDRKFSSAEAVAEYERQLKLFRKRYDMQPRTTRHHSTGWVGYLDLVETQERLGIEMDANYFSGHVFRDREHAPYSPFGSAMPMRFCHPDGRMSNVFQQHTQINDDIFLAPDRPYSYHLSDQVFSHYLRRMLLDSRHFFHVPMTVNFHPGNWVLFSQRGGEEVLAQARANEISVWSLDQWLDFWKCRDSWSITVPAWNNHVFTCTFSGKAAHHGLCFALPVGHDGGVLESVVIDNTEVQWIECVRFCERTALIAFPADVNAFAVKASYRDDV